MFAGSLILLFHLPHVEATLADWARQFDEPETQRTILDRIFPGQIGPASSAQTAKDGRTLLFPKGGMWVSLGSSFAYESKPSSPFMVISSIVFQRLDRKAMSTVSYLLRDDSSRPVALTGGYSANESATVISLSQLNRVFILIESSSPDGARGDQLSATLYDVPPSGSSRLKAVWTSPRSLWRFRFGFDALGGRSEALVLKSLSGQSGDDFYVYRWDGDRFMRDEMTREGKIESLEESVWKYGSQP